MTTIADLRTPALLIDEAVLAANLAKMAAALPGARMRPHVKAHKCTNLARRQAAVGHAGFTCATIRECEGMVAAGLGDDLLLANEVLDATRLGVLVRSGARITLAVDSPQTIDAAAAAGVREVLIDVNVGLPRCGCPPEKAGQLCDLARAKGLQVRGVMGYEGHVVGLEDAAERAAKCQESMEQLIAAHADVGGAPYLGRRHRHLRDQHLGERDPGRLLRPDGYGLRQARPAVRPGAVRARHGDLREQGMGCRRTPASKPSAWTTATRRSPGRTSGTAQTSTRCFPRRGRSATGYGWYPPTSTPRWPTTSAPTSPATTRSSTSGP